MSEALPVFDQLPVVVPKWTKAQVALLGRTVAKGCTEDELKLFIYICKRSGLDPFLRQIYAYKNWDSELGDYKMIVVTGIDGFRLCGSRTKRVAGVPLPEFEADVSESWHPAVARVTVKMFAPNGTGEITEFVGEARWKEFARKKKDGGYRHMWSEDGGMPFQMLAKCAEAAAWRKAAPAETIGLMVREEIIDLDFEVLEGPSTGTITPPADNVIDEGFLIGYEAPKEMPASKGKRAHTRPGSVLIETTKGNVKLTFFNRPTAFKDDVEAQAAAQAKVPCQFSVESKGEYRNLSHFALKPAERREELPELTSRAAYMTEIADVGTIEAVSDLLNRILEDKTLSKPVKDELWQKAKAKKDTIEK